MPDTTGQEQSANDKAEVIIPKTGDESNDVALYIMLSGAAIMLTLAAFWHKKVKDGETEL